MAVMVKNEISKLKQVIVGMADYNGPIPKVEEAYDPQSLRHVIKGTYPSEEELVQQLEALCDTLRIHGVEVFRPQLMRGVNQIFTRDVGFVISNRFFKSNILPDREEEWLAIKPLIESLDIQVHVLPEEVHVEGGDVILYDDFLFVGTYYGADYASYKTARTNPLAVNCLKELFPNKTVVGIDLLKSDVDPRAGALHLDCCFQPVGQSYALVCFDVFRDEKDVEFIKQHFSADNLYILQKEEMSQLQTNVVSIDANTLISDKRFNRLNDWLKSKDITVIELDYSAVGKLGGLFRCSTLPLIRE